MLAPVTLPDLFSAISSPDLAVGVTPCALPDGPTTDLFGRAVAHANLSAPPALKKAPLMIDTSGLSGSISSASAALESSLVSKLKQRLTTDGSILFNLIWKAKATPAGRQVYRLRASGRRTLDNDCGLWQTPKALDGVFSTPRTTGRPMHRATHLQTQTIALLTNADPTLASWPTASARDWKDTSGMATTATNPDGSTRSRLDQLPRVAGLTAIGSPAATENHGQLNPAHSRWLMGLPPEWDACAPTATPSSRKSRKSL
jgi:hypothetical protein